MKKLLTSKRVFERLFRPVLMLNMDFSYIKQAKKKKDWLC